MDGITTSDRDGSQPPGGRRSMDGEPVRPPLRAVLEIFMAGWPGGLCFSNQRRGRPTYHAWLASRRVARRSPALDLFHASAQGSAVVESSGYVVLWHRHTDEHPGTDCGPLAV